VARCQGAHGLTLWPGFHMQVREQRVGADMGKQTISDGHQRYEHRYGAQDQTVSQESLGFFAFAMKPAKQPGCHASAAGFRRVREEVRAMT